jgi:hypothetical protein
LTFLSGSRLDLHRNVKSKATLIRFSGRPVAKEADEDGVLIFRIDRLAFVDRVTD